MNKILAQSFIYAHRFLNIFIIFYYIIYLLVFLYLFFYIFVYEKEQMIKEFAPDLTLDVT